MNTLSSLLFPLSSNKGLSSFHFPLSSRMGQAILSTVLLIGGIIVLIGISLAFLANSFINSSYGFKAAQRAQAVAASGVYDGLLQLSRNMSFSSTGYSVALGSDTATVTVTQGSPIANEAKIVSTATVSLRTRTITAIVSIDSNTGQVVLLSWVQT